MPTPEANEAISSASNNGYLSERVGEVKSTPAARALTDRSTSVPSLHAGMENGRGSSAIPYL